MKISLACPWSSTLLLHHCAFQINNSLRKECFHTALATYHGPQGPPQLCMPLAGLLLPLDTPSGSQHTRLHSPGFPMPLPSPRDILPHSCLMNSHDLVPAESPFLQESATPQPLLRVHPRAGIRRGDCRVTAPLATVSSFGFAFGISVTVVPCSPRGIGPVGPQI